MKHGFDLRLSALWLVRSCRQLSAYWTSCYPPSRPQSIRCAGLQVINFSYSMLHRPNQQSILARRAMFSVVDLMNGFNERRCIVTNELLIVYLIIYMKLLRMWAVWFSVVDVQHLSWIFLWMDWCVPLISFLVAAENVCWYIMPVIMLIKKYWTKPNKV